ncbi:MAG: hypothetical protein JWP11_1144 [Frankiales bacterium]|nr:hypothetical protein [Frankiales bacterium]
MRLHVFYRLYPAESGKRRPTFHTKPLCLQSAFMSLERVPQSRLVLLVDAEDLTADFTAVIPDGTEIQYLGGVGNRVSYQRQLDRLLEIPAGDVVFLSEDDYLYRPEAFSTLMSAVADLPDVGYFGLYDHPDRYTRQDDARIYARRQVRLGGGVHWRLAESSCMTFGALAGTIHSDVRVHRRFVPRGGYRRNPVSRMLHYNDRRFWRLLQGIGPYRWKRPKRQLATPIPSLATHMDMDFMAPGVDWAEVAAVVRG